MNSSGSETDMKNWKALTIFYSHSGITRACARALAGAPETLLQVSACDRLTRREVPLLHRHGVAEGVVWP